MDERRVSWDGLMSDCEAKIKECEKKIRDLRKSFRFFKKQANSGVPFPNVKMTPREEMRKVRG